MKKLGLALLFTLLISLGFISCESTRSVTSTKSNTGYIQLVGNKAVYPGSAIITIDDKASYQVEINSDQDLTIKNPVTYAIAPGAHMIEVIYNDEVILFKKVFITAQSVNVVTLP